MTDPDSPEIYAAPIETQLWTFIGQYRELLPATVDGLTEEEARRRLVPSMTTLLGLVKHAAMVERVWFEEAPTGLSRLELGIPLTPDESFALEDTDTIASVRASYAATVRASAERMQGIGLDDSLPGNRRGPLPLRWILLHVLREYAQHLGHAEILREQILAERTRDTATAES
jgi:hypothetical protein